MWPQTGRLEETGPNRDELNQKAFVHSWNQKQSKEQAMLGSETRGLGVQLQQEAEIAPTVGLWEPFPSNIEGTKNCSKHPVYTYTHIQSPMQVGSYSYQQPAQKIQTRATTICEPIYGIMFPFSTDLDPMGQRELFFCKCKSKMFGDCLKPSWLRIFNMKNIGDHMKTKPHYKPIFFKKKKKLDSNENMFNGKHAMVRSMRYIYYLDTPDYF